jgi:alpha-glucoside transport system substrate-binding protein
MRTRPGRARAVALLAALVWLVAAGCTGRDGSSRVHSLRGERLEVMATWTGVEQERFLRVMAPFERRTGVVVTYTPAEQGVPDALARRTAAGRLPDVAFLPQPGLLREDAAAGRLTPLDAATRNLVQAHFSAAFRDLASYRGRLYGVWFKAANKSLVWYDVATFERLGVVPPRTLDGLLSLTRRIAATGTEPFAVSAKEPWTLTDWFENLYLRLSGPVLYDELTAHRIPWTHPSVAATLRELSLLLPTASLPGGVAGALRTGFEASVQQVFDRPSRAAMVMEADFVAGFITGLTRAKLGVDADAFAFPSGPSGAPAVVGGGDVAVLLRQSPAGAALLRYLATPEAAVPWAAAGGFVSPNLDLDLSVYPDDITRGIARRLLEAGEDFRFDLSDLAPAEFGGSDRRGMAAELRAFLVSRDVTRTCARLEAEARVAYAGAT